MIDWILTSWGWGFWLVVFSALVLACIGAVSYLALYLLWLAWGPIGLVITLSFAALTLAVGIIGNWKERPRRKDADSGADGTEQP